MHWFTNAIKNKYAEFTGRAHRTEYWMFTLILVIAYFIFIALTSAMAAVEPITSTILASVFGLLFLAVLVPSLAVTVRRLHDTGRSGWWFFISFVPLIGGLILLVFLCLDSEAGENKWGLNPKGSSE